MDDPACVRLSIAPTISNRRLPTATICSFGTRSRDGFAQKTPSFAVCRNRSPEFRGGPLFLETTPGHGPHCQMRQVEGLALARAWVRIPVRTNNLRLFSANRKLSSLRLFRSILDLFAASRASSDERRRRQEV